MTATQTKHMSAKASQLQKSINRDKIYSTGIRPTKGSCEKFVIMKLIVIQLCSSLDSSMNLGNLKNNKPIYVPFGSGRVNVTNYNFITKLIPYKEHGKLASLLLARREPAVI